MRQLIACKLILLTLLLTTVILLTGCLDSPPSVPVRDNPWDPENPSSPRAPQGFTAIPLSETAIALSWRDRSGNEDGFIIYESFGNEDGMHFADTVNADVENIVLTQRPRGIEKIRYFIEAFNSKGSEYISPPVLTSTLEAPPMPPLAFQAMAEPDSVIRLTWTRDSEIEEQYEIEQSLGDPTAFHLIATTPADFTSLKIESLNPEVVYFFRIRAGNIYGKSIYVQSSGVHPG